MDARATYCLDAAQKGCVCVRCARAAVEPAGCCVRHPDVYCPPGLVPGGVRQSCPDFVAAPRGGDGHAPQ